MVRLHVFADPWDINPSPFCLEVATYCRLANNPFVMVPTLPLRAPHRNPKSAFVPIDEVIARAAANVEAQLS